MNKSESKYFNTARLMDAALLNLLEKKQYEYITVKEVCEKAGVNRSTFYLHYENMNDLLSESVAYIMQEKADRFKSRVPLTKEQIETAPLDDLLLITPQYLVPYLEFVKEHKSVFAAFASQPAVFNTSAIFGNLYDEVFNPILTRFSVPAEEKQYRLVFSLNGIYAVIQEWMKSGCRENSEYIAGLLIDFIPHKR